MNTLKSKQIEPTQAVGVTFTDLQFTVALKDGRYLTIPLWRYPRLERATRLERRNWKLLGTGVVIHWPDLDEFIEVDHLVRGCKAAELKQLSTLHSQPSTSSLSLQSKV